MNMSSHSLQHDYENVSEPVVVGGFLQQDDKVYVSERYWDKEYGVVHSVTTPTVPLTTSCTHKNDSSDGERFLRGVVEAPEEKCYGGLLILGVMLAWGITCAVVALGAFLLLRWGGQ
jgi:hypothetical protein